MSSGGTITFEIRTNANDLVQVTGNLTLNNNTITPVPLNDLQTNVPYTLVTYTGTRSGTFNPVLNLDTNFTATLDYSTPGQVKLIFSKVQTFNIPTEYPTGSGTPNITVGLDGRLVYSYGTNGDSIPDFSNCGYGGGGVPIPDVPVVTTLSPVAGDNQPQIQAALNAMAALPLNTNGFRGAVLLNPGTYTITTGIGMSVSGVVLRGSGTNSTILSLSNGFSGEAISIGQVAAAELSEALLDFPEVEAQRIADLFRRAGLPTSVELNKRQFAQLSHAMKLDKKVSGGEIKFVLIDAPGHAIVRGAPDEVVREVIALCCRPD